jgi:hypothetical protein
MAHHDTLNLPYHLRAPRLRWEALAIDLSEDETVAFQLLATDPSQPLKARNQASLMLALDQRKPIHDLCEEFHMDRRTLFRLAFELAESKARHRFLAEHDAL